MDEKPGIVDVLEYYARIEHRDFTLSKMAGKVQINCPFHDDDHPSARVNLETERFRCFANCGAPAGDSLDIIQEREGIGFREAQQWARDHIGYESGEVRSAPSGGRYRPAYGSGYDD